jgi:hypothetical protein
VKLREVSGVMKTVRSDLDLPFFRDRVRYCIELAEMSRSVPSIKFRLEALARKYRQRLDDLESTSQESPPLVPDHRDDGSHQLMSGAVSANAL